MRQHVSMRIQLIIFMAFLIASFGLWLQREEVSAFFSQVTEKSKQQKNANARLLPVVIEPVKSAANDDNVEALGTARALRFITLFPETDGEITKLNIKSGQKINKGDVILQLDMRDAVLARKVAETKVLEEQRLVTRSNELLKKKITSKANVVDAQTRLARAKLELDQALETLKNRQVIAPFTGIIGIPKVEMGDRVSRTTELMTLDDRSILIIEFEIPEIYISRIKRGNTVLAMTPTYNQREFIGTIKSIDSRINPTSRSVMVRAHIPNQEDLLRPGMSFITKVKLTGDTYPLIPELALNWSKGKSYVWKIQDNKAKRVAIQIVKRLNSTILVNGDLKEGDQVIVEGLHRLRDGAEVTFEQVKPELF